MVLVFAIAAGAVGREAQKLDAVPARPIFDPDEATSWIAEHLSPQVTAAVTYADVQRIVEWTIELLRSNAGVVAQTGDVPDVGSDRVVGEDEAVTNVLRQAGGAGMVISYDQTAAVVAAVFAYLEVIGAVGPVKDEF